MIFPPSLVCIYDGMFWNFVQSMNFELWSWAWNLTSIEKKTETWLWITEMIYKLLPFVYFFINK
jgi:hypothetical protein